jgi:hypothetical protein
MPNSILPTVAAKNEIDTRDPDKLRKLASWYREFAERAGSPVIWEGRLRMAGDLEAEADRMERTPPGRSARRGGFDE